MDSGFTLRVPRNDEQSPLDTPAPRFVNRTLLAPLRAAGRIAQRESVPFTRERSKVRSLVRPPAFARAASYGLASHPDHYRERRLSRRSLRRRRTGATPCVPFGLRMAQPARAKHVRRSLSTAKAKTDDLRPRCQTACARDLAAQRARVIANKPALETEGAGKAGCSAAPAASYAN